MSGGRAGVMRGAGGVMRKGGEVVRVEWWGSSGVVEDD